MAAAARRAGPGGHGRGGGGGRRAARRRRRRRPRLPGTDDRDHHPSPAGLAAAPPPPGLARRDADDADHLHRPAGAGRRAGALGGAAGHAAPRLPDAVHRPRRPDHRLARRERRHRGADQRRGQAARPQQPGRRPAGSSPAPARATRQYIVVSTVFGLIVALLDVAALYWLDVPLPWLWGLLAFITNYIPNIGFVLGLVPPALLALLQGGVRQAVLVVIAYTVINLVIQSLIQPKFVGDAVGLSITLTFLSLVFWSFIIGPLGALLAVPLSLLAKALLVDADPDSRWLIPLIAPGHRGVQDRRDGEG